MPAQAQSPVPKFRRTAGASSVPPVAIVLLVAIVALAGTNVYTIVQLKDFREQTDDRFATHEERLAVLDGSVQRTSSELVSQVGEMKSLVESAEMQGEARVRQAESKMLGRTETLQEEFTETLQEELEATRATSAAEIRQVRQEAIQKTDALGGEVKTVKEEVDATRAELEKTIAELTSVKGDLGVQSGLIATNGEELAALKRLGERNYYEFNLRRTRSPQRVGPVSVKLTGTDRKRNRYSIELWADDKRIVKNRKTLLEPVQFYVAGSRIPYELVVNKIDSGVIEGYLSTPLETPRGSVAEAGD